MAKSDYPLVPLPNPGEGGPVDPGEDMPLPPVPDQNGGTPEAGEPVIPLPNPGEGGPVGPARPPFIPVFPLPGPIWPGYAQVRFLNAAYGYPALRVVVDRNRGPRFLSFSALSAYGRVTPGYRTVTVMGPDGYVYIQKSLPFRGGGVYTVAVVNRPGGLDLVQISDQCCQPENGNANIRVSNLAARSRPVDMLLADGRTISSDVRFKETTAFKRIRPGAYEFLFADTDQTPMPEYTDVETLDSVFLGVHPLPNLAASVYLNVVRGSSNTIFLLNGGPQEQLLAIAAQGR